MHRNKYKHRQHKYKTQTRNHTLTFPPAQVSHDWFYHNGSAFLVPAYPGCPGKRPLNECSSSSSSSVTRHKLLTYLFMDMCQTHWWLYLLLHGDRIVIFRRLGSRRGLWPWNSNLAKIFGWCTYPPNFIILCLIVQKLSCWQTNKQSSRRYWKHPLHFAMLRQWRKTRRIVQT